VRLRCDGSKDVLGRRRPNIASSLLYSGGVKNIHHSESEFDIYYLFTKR